MTDEMMNVSHRSPLRLQTLRARTCRVRPWRGSRSVVCEVFQRQAPESALPVPETVRPKAPRPYITLGRILIQAGAAKGFQIVFPVSILFDRHLVCEPGERNIGLRAAKLCSASVAISSYPAMPAAAVSTR